MSFPQLQPEYEQAASRLNLDPFSLALALESGVFTATDAAAYLHLPSVMAFHYVRRGYGLDGVQLAPGHTRYSREQLDSLPRRKWRRQPFSVTYFVRGVDGPIKIGRTRKILGRLADLQHASPIPLFYIGLIFSDCERELHAKFKANRLHGEWFEPTEELLEYIRTAKGEFNG